VLPSSTKTICKLNFRLPRTATSLWCVAKMTSCSLKHGITTDNENRAGRVRMKTDLATTRLGSATLRRGDACSLPNERIRLSVARGRRR
jgi:hypothetical protein